VQGCTRFSGILAAATILFWLCARYLVPSALYPVLGVQCSVLSAQCPVLSALSSLLGALALCPVPSVRCYPSSSAAELAAPRRDVLCRGALPRSSPRSSPRRAGMSSRRSSALCDPNTYISARSARHPSPQLTPPSRQSPAGLAVPVPSRSSCACPNQCLMFSSWHCSVFSDADL